MLVPSAPYLFKWCLKNAVVHPFTSAVPPPHSKSFNTTLNHINTQNCYVWTNLATSVLRLCFCTDTVHPLLWFQATNGLLKPICSLSHYISVCILCTNKKFNCNFDRLRIYVVHIGVLPLYAQYNTQYEYSPEDSVHAAGVSFLGNRMLN